MPVDIVIFISKYGYLAIFILIFSQEIGIPNPIPNELVLMFSGFLTLKGILFLPFVILTALSADFIGTNILYTVFYFFGAFLLQHKPRWFPFSQKAIDKVKKRVASGGKWTIYIGRLTPFIRGYTSVITGLLQIKPKIFLPIALISATTWSTVCIMTGRILGPYVDYAGSNLKNMKYVMLSIALIVLTLIIVRYFNKRAVLKKDRIV